MQLKHQRDEGAVLQNDVVTAQRNLDAVTQRLAQSNLQSQTPAGYDRDVDAGDAACGTL